MNPKTACLKRREEEKTEQAVTSRFMSPQLGGQIPPPNVVISPPGSQQMPGPMGGGPGSGQIPHMMNTGQHHQQMMMPSQNHESHGLVLDSLS